MENIAKNIIMVGSILLFIGALIYLQDKVNFAGKLPGDFIIKKKGFTMYIPLTTTLIFTLVINIVINLKK
jgi:hypothetical protein